MPKVLSITAAPDSKDSPSKRVITSPESLVVHAQNFVDVEWHPDAKREKPRVTSLESLKGGFRMVREKPSPEASKASFEKAGNISSFPSSRARQYKSGKG